MNLEGFEKLSVPAKGIAAAIVFQLPFWLVSIYLFNYDLYFSKDYLLLSSLCLALAISMSAINIVLAGMALIMEYVVLKDLFKKMFSIDELFVYTSVLCLISISLSLFISFFINMFYPLKYYVFLIIALALNILIPVLYMYRLIRKRKKQIAEIKMADQ